MKWLVMLRRSKEIVGLFCTLPNSTKVLNGEIQKENWQEPYLRYLLKGVLLADFWSWQG